MSFLTARGRSNQGREFAFAGRKAPGRVNTMVIGYAEIDGVPARVLPEGPKAAQLSRTVLFTEVRPEKVADAGSAR